MLELKLQTIDGNGVQQRLLSWGSYAGPHITWTFVHLGEAISTHQGKSVQICRNSEHRVNQDKDK